MSEALRFLHLDLKITTSYYLFATTFVVLVESCYLVFQQPLI